MSNAKKQNIYKNALQLQAYLSLQALQRLQKPMRAPGDQPQHVGEGLDHYVY